ncbi:MAG: SDR family NAD(P)-dependent oxidoreductase [Dehalococcoidia bacterium]
MSNFDFSLEGKRAIVTGASRGMGRAFALALAQKGADVALADISPDIEGVVQEIRKMGRRSLGVPTDITQRDQVEKLVASAVEELGTVDILVNNAGIMRVAPFLELGENTWDKVMDTNLKGCYLCSQAAGRVMAEKGGGSIISLASIAAFRSVANTSAYCVSKAGVVMLTKAMAAELAPYNIRANAIAPGLVQTHMTRAVFADPTWQEAWVSRIPLGRPAQPEDMVGAVLFLASDASSYITGQTIALDGGELA